MRKYRKPGFWQLQLTQDPQIPLSYIVYFYTIFQIIL